MSPEQKSLLVQSYKNEKLTVLMCGDGANDCSALRNADIGVSLSPEEASIAAPGQPYHAFRRDPSAKRPSRSEGHNPGIQPSRDNPSRF